MKKSSAKGVILLLVTAMIWGCAFVAQSTAMNSIGPFTFQAVRSVLGAVVLIPVILVLDGSKKRNGTYHKMEAKDKKMLILGGALCGTALCAASCFQQFGVCYTTVGKAGFITAMYILIVPILGLLLRKRIPGKIWICILIAVIGLYLLCMNGSFTLSLGDGLMLICAVLFAVQIMLVDYFIPYVDGVKLSCVQFLVTAVIAAVLMFIFERPSMDSILSAWLPIVYAGIGSCGIAYTLQIVGQKYTEPTVASLLMSLESVFATLAGVVLLHQIPSGREWVGIGLMFGAIILSQIKFKTKKI